MSDGASRALLTALVLLPLLAKPHAVFGEPVSGVAGVPCVSPASERLKPGDRLQIAADQAALRLGDRVIASLGKGQETVVSEIVGPWVGVQASMGGQSLAGWVHLQDFVPIGRQVASSERVHSGPQPYTTFRPVTPEPAVMYAPPVPVQRYYQPPPPSYERDSFMIGRYERHEMDPNIHKWEPWRQ